MVRVEVAPAAVGVTAAGLKAADTPVAAAGTEAVNVTPPTGGVPEIRVAVTTDVVV